MDLCQEGYSVRNTDTMVAVVIGDDDIQVTDRHLCHIK